jgi:ribosomal protein S28E/S33
MSKRIEISTVINKPLNVVWDEVKIMENHVNWMEDAVKIDILSENNSGLNTKMNVLTKVGPITLNDIITVTEWKEKKSIGVIHEGIVTGEGVFYLTSLDESKTKFQWVEILKFPFYLGGPLGEIFGGLILKLIWKKNLKNLKEIIE